ncbi:hypothetical protein [Nonomuraea sp. NPDC050540]|uniref:hypothetical protein n=1 Tax=Nonomuraea sp. NPDC050540 TaxID=3364367 RepID=UPI0037B9F3EB
MVSTEAGATSRAAGLSGTAGRRTALLVANAAYEDPGLSRLRSPVSDIRALAEVLGEPAIVAFDVGTLTDAGESVLRRRVAALFADRQPDDVLLLPRAQGPAWPPQPGGGRHRARLARGDRAAGVVRRVAR